MVSYYCRKRPDSSEKGTAMLRAIAGLFPYKAQLLKQHFIGETYWYQQELHQLNKKLRKVNERLVMKYAEVEIESISYLDT